MRKIRSGEHRKLNPSSMESFGTALWEYFNGNTKAELILHRDDGQKGTLPVSHFFREPDAFTSIEKTAIEQCNGRVLDVGAGTGSNSLELQKKGLQVTAIDINSHAVEIMRQRGVKDVFCSDIFKFTGGPFDIMLLMGHGIGMVETIDGLDRLLLYAQKLLTEGGQILFDSLDVRITDDPMNLAYHDLNRRSGRYIGEIRLQVEFQKKKSPYYGWLHVDPATLDEHAHKFGWKSEVITMLGGEFLARLTKIRQI